MKLTCKQNKAFSPRTLTLEIQTEEELFALKSMSGMNFTVADETVKRYPEVNQKLLQDILCGIHAVLEK